MAFDSYGLKRGMSIDDTKKGFQRPYHQYHQMYPSATRECDLNQLRTWRHQSF